LHLPRPEGAQGKYIKFSTQIVALGWNNVFNELFVLFSIDPTFLTYLVNSLLCAHLAWRVKRAYVFQDYVWKPEYYPWRIREWPWPRNPLNTLISGPTAGGPWGPSDDTPRSVSEDWFDVVCPPKERELIVSTDVKAPVNSQDGKTMMDHWVYRLMQSDARCVEVVAKKGDHFPQVFDLWCVLLSFLLCGSLR
jgi:hypothetical protein